IFSMSVSFHVDEPGLSHQAPMPQVPKPDSLPDDAELRQAVLARMPEAVRRYYERERPIELRPVELDRYLGKATPDGKFHVWIRAIDRLPDQPAFHRRVLALGSDVTLPAAPPFPPAPPLSDPGIGGASLDHALWFHRPFRADEWLLYAQDSPSATGARGFSRGMIFAADGTLVASVAQEGMIRERRRPAT